MWYRARKKKRVKFAKNIKKGLNYDAKHDEDVNTKWCGIKFMDFFGGNAFRVVKCIKIEIWFSWTESLPTEKRRIFFSLSITLMRLQ